MADDNERKSPAQSDLEKITAVFVRHKVEFLVIGGQAEILMGGARVTFDTDLCYRRTPENLERLAAALAEMNPSLRGAPRDLPYRLDARALAFGNNYTLDTSFGPLDLLGWVEPIGNYEDLFSRYETYELRGQPLGTIGLGDLIRIKEHLGRTKDRDSLLQLLAIQRIRNETQGKKDDG
ncbi:MAG TPA: hypothetical protein VFW73_13875 [Lacipirellulaceae bacterium]|nr:hypothetical protein [Lacipirellulaceae bacterium]